MRDTLGFLKKSEEEKKKREEEKLQTQADKNSKYKALSEISYATNGYDGENKYDYTLG